MGGKERFKQPSILTFPRTWTPLSVTRPSSFSQSTESPFSLNPSFFSTQSSQYKAKTKTATHAHKQLVSRRYSLARPALADQSQRPEQGEQSWRLAASLGQAAQGRGYSPRFSGKKGKITPPPYDPAIPLLGIYPEKTIIQKETWGLPWWRSGWESAC